LQNSTTEKELNAREPCVQNDQPFTCPALQATYGVVFNALTPTQMEDVGELDSLYLKAAEMCGVLKLSCTHPACDL
jgi:hypothetical protein